MCVRARPPPSVHPHHRRNGKRRENIAKRNLGSAVDQVPPRLPTLTVNLTSNKSFVLLLFFFLRPQTTANACIAFCLDVNIRAVKHTTTTTTRTITKGMMNNAEISTKKCVSSCHIFSPLLSSSTYKRIVLWRDPLPRSVNTHVLMYEELSSNINRA